MSDKQWLDEKLTETGFIATSEQVDEFIERVAIMHIDGGVEIERARLLSFNKVMGAV
ncbi:MAG: hypothetical protein WC714_28440 [Candidatus Obscuribacterales bacterium]